MKKSVNMVAYVAAVILVCVFNFFFASCTDEHEETVQTRSLLQAPAVVTPDNRTASFDVNMNCTPSESSFNHVCSSTIRIFKNGELENEMKRQLNSKCEISCTPDTVRISDGFEVKQTNVSISRSRTDNYENDVVRISVSDGRILELPYSAEYAGANWMSTYYTHGHDSLISARLIKVENSEIGAVTRAAVASQYIKNRYNTKYFVEVTTKAYANGNVISTDLDTLATSAVTLVVDDNNVTNVEKTTTGVEVLNENQQKDSVIITKTWADGHTERYSFNTILNRWLKNIEKREVIVSSFDNRTAGSSFSKVEGGESVVRQDNMWTIYGREVVIVKMASVNGVTEEVKYTYYQERAEFNYEGVSHSFEYVDWQIDNYSDNFKSAPISDKNGYDQLNYKNEIKTYYLGFVQMSEETIAWYKESVKIKGYGVIDANRVDYTTYTLVSLTKVAYYSDGHEEKVGTFSAKLPISVKALTNWTINADVWGVYTSNDLTNKMAAKSAKTAEKFFSYNQYTYNFSNEVSGQLNKGEVIVPNDIVFNDGDVEYNFANSDLNVKKNNEGTSFVSENDEKSTYSYACVAGVEFGETSQEVTLPGTIYLAKQQPVEPEVNHEHGKIKATYMTSTPNENRSHWKNVAVIEFEDGYRMVGMAENNATEFNFTMSSTKNVNSAVYTGGKWIPAIAQDTDRSMKWKDENGTTKRSLDYISATAQGWNNGHNTVVDVRREGKISEDGYSVTFYLNGLAGQTLNF
jgi:hypothetical protein